MNQLSRALPIFVLSILAPVFSSCEDSLPGAPYVVPFDSLAGRNGNIFYTKIYPDEVPIRAEIDVHDIAEGDNQVIGGDGFLVSEPGRDKLVYMKFVDFAGNIEVYEMSHDGATRSEIKLNLDPFVERIAIGSVAISFEGNRLAFAVEEIPTGQTRLWCLSQGGIGAPTPLKVADNFAFGTTPSFSPDGTDLAYFTQEYDINGAVIPGQDGFAIAEVVATPTSRQAMQGSFDIIGEETIDWSPDGTEVLITGEFVVYRINASNITNQATANAVHGSFSPTGKQVVYSDLLAGNNLVIHDLEKNTFTQLTFTSDSVAYYPQWSPDGQWIVYSSFDPLDDDALADIKIVNVKTPTNTKVVGSLGGRPFWVRRQGS